MAGLRKVKIDWDFLRSLDRTPLLTLEEELEEAIRQEYEQRRLAYLEQKKGEKKRRRRRRLTPTATEETPPTVS